ncbi:MAG: hypothetical protein SFY80_00800 [Verrucomicrobiota bacterium]|nr:hypothetical protein [Verrucomicrobiota bacterium]
MNNSNPTAYVCNETKAIDAFFALRDKRLNAAKGFIARRDQASIDLDKARNAFSQSLTEKDLSGLSVADREHQIASLAAAILEKVGIAEFADEVLNQIALFKLLGSALAAKAAIYGKLAADARKTYGAREGARIANGDTSYDRHGSNLREFIESCTNQQATITFHSQVANAWPENPWSTQITPAQLRELIAQPLLTMPTE